MKSTTAVVVIVLALIDLNIDVIESKCCEPNGYYSIGLLFGGITTFINVNNEISSNINIY